MKKLIFLFLISFSINCAFSADTTRIDTTEIKIIEKVNSSNSIEFDIIIYTNAVTETAFDLVLSDSIITEYFEILYPRNTKSLSSDSSIVKVNLANLKPIDKSITVGFGIKYPTGDTLANSHTLKIIFEKSTDKPKDLHVLSENVVLGDQRYGVHVKKNTQTTPELYIVSVQAYETDSIEKFQLFTLEPNPNNIDFFNKSMKKAISDLNKIKNACISKKDIDFILRVADSIDSSFQTYDEKINDTLTTIFSKLETCTVYGTKTAESAFQPLIDSLMAYRKDEQANEIKITLGTIKNTIAEKNKDLNEEISSFSSAMLFKSHLATEMLEDSNPQVGSVYVTEKAEIKYANVFGIIKSDPTKIGRKVFKKAYKNPYQKELTIVDVKMEFEKEQLVHCRVHAKAKKGNETVDIFFENKVPFPYSRKKDLNKSKKLFIQNGRSIFAGSRRLVLDLKDVIPNDPDDNINSENYSPNDTVITLLPSDNPIALRKPKLSSVLNGRIYSDFLGLNESNPNGLIQTEFKKRLFLNPMVYRLGWTTSYFGFLNSFQPKFVLSKAEQNNRNLEIDFDRIAGATDTSNFIQDTLVLRTDPMSLFKFSKINTGGEINAAYVGIPAIHTNIYFNLGGSIRITDLLLPEYDTDSTFVTNTRTERENVSSYLKPNSDNVVDYISVWGFTEFVIEFNPRPRLDFGFSIKFFTLPFQSKIIGLKPAAENYNFTKEEFHKIMNFTKINSDLINVKFEAAWQLKETVSSKLFFRTYYTFAPKDTKQDFFQMQVGYSRNLFTFFKH